MKKIICIEVEFSNDDQDNFNSYEHEIFSSKKFISKSKNLKF